MNINIIKSIGLFAISSLLNFVEAQTQMNWSPAGPIYNAGRARNIVVDKNDLTGNTIYIGSASSGIFKTIDGGGNWLPMFDQGTIRNISYMAQGFDGSIYASTGEGFLRPDKILKAQKGTGLYKLTGTSGSYSLVLLQDSSMVGAVINRIACHPTNASIIALATNKGILISNNGGTSFSPAAGISATVNLTYGMDVKFDNAGILYCSIGSERAIAPFTSISSKIYKSTDNSLSNFSSITPTSSVLADANYGRIELAISASNNSVIYASCAKKHAVNANNSASLKGLFVSYDSGSNWGLILQGSPQLDPLSNGISSSSGDYSQVLLVDPTNSNLLYFGGYNFYTFLKTGGTANSPIGIWSQKGNPFALNSPLFLNRNIHDIKIVQGKFYFVTDAGVYRSIDMSNNSSFLPPSFQPFYKGLITGQFNSVSIETFPLSSSTLVANQSSVTPYSGFIGGTGGNGLTYFSGKYPNATQETNYISGDVYQSEFSKLLPGVAFFSSSNGSLYRSTDIKNSDPNVVDMNIYSGALSVISAQPSGFSNGTFTSSGTPFKLWENYGQVKKTPDSLVFYNDTLRVQSSFASVPELNTKTTFTFSAARPNRFALIDSIVVRTATVVLPLSAPLDKCQTPFLNTDKKDLTIKLANNYTLSTSIISPSITGTTGPMSSSGVTINPLTLLDAISVSYSLPPFSTKTITSYGATAPDPSSYYRVFATIFYKYKIGDSIKITDNSISTKVYNYSKVLTQPISWAYGSRPAYIVSAISNSAVSNPTYVLNPGNINQSNNVFTVNPVGIASYTIIPTGNYTFSAPPINSYSIAAITNTAITNSTYNLMPGNITQTNSIFIIVTPTVSNNYTITQTGSGTITAATYSTIGTTSYVLNPGNINQSSPVFTISYTGSQTFTASGISSNTLSAANTSAIFIAPVKTFSTVGSNTVPLCKNNTLQKLATLKSSRLALALNVAGITNNAVNANAIVVSKAPLNLNDPLNFIRVSQSGCLTSDALGNSTYSTITITGKPTLLEWSKSGSELYYATDDFNLYRVSNLNSLMDLSPTSYSGKLSTDIFKYVSTINGTPDTNRVSPFRTTLLGTFTKPITSIALTNNDSLMALTFNDPTGTIVNYSTNDVRKSNFSNINFVSKNGTGLTSASVTAYCSLMEKNDNKKVFIGTDNGVFYTADITVASPTWLKVNNNQLPNVQIFDIKQQLLNPWDCYNSGQIYVATNGRGVWTNNTYLQPFVVSENELAQLKTENSLRAYPNPTNGEVFISFNGFENEIATINLIDINGRIIKSENLGKIEIGLVNYIFDTSNFNSGIYFVKVISNSGINRVTKLIISK